MKELALRQVEVVRAVMIAGTMELLATTERHAKRARWASADYAQESQMTVHAFTIPMMP